MEMMKPVNLKTRNIVVGKCSKFRSIPVSSLFQLNFPSLTILDFSLYQPYKIISYVLKLCNDIHTLNLLLTNPPSNVHCPDVCVYVTFYFHLSLAASTRSRVNHLPL